MNGMDSSTIRRTAQTIWRAGVESVAPATLIAKHMELQGTQLRVRDAFFELNSTRRLVVVGGGKAAAAMATAIEAQLGNQLSDRLPGLVLEGLVTCPELEPTQRAEFSAQLQGRTRAITLLEARPIGINAPTELAMQGSAQMLDLVANCQPEDMVLCLLSGGGSALLTAPVAGINLRDKQAIAATLAGAGASIEQLNTVRRAVSRIKGGGLARACKAGRLVTTILSDVLGDSLDTIASGPTVPDANGDAQAALNVLVELGLADNADLARVKICLEAQRTHRKTEHSTAPSCEIQNIILGNNLEAVQAAQTKALELGYSCPAKHATSADQSEPDVKIIAEQQVRLACELMQAKTPACFISGGEPTVNLPEHPGRGGRNQQLALHLLIDFLNHDRFPVSTAPLNEQHFLFMSGGTDGEDGPTDAAGAWFDEQILREAQRLAPEVLDNHLARADAYPLFERLGGLLRTGVTGTNVCDLRIGLFQPGS